MPFTTPGLGDRVHSALLAWLWSGGEPVSIHITDDKWSRAGGEVSDKKKKSWAEICDLFPGEVNVVPHSVENLPEEKWLDYLREKGIEATTYHYADSFNMHPQDYPIGVDASQLLKKLPQLLAKKPAGYPDLSRKPHIAYNFNTTDPGRKLLASEPPRVLKKWQDLGYQAIEITGDMPLNQAAYIISTAGAFVGVDSGIFHLATLYKRWNDIELHQKASGFRSHHFERAIRNGSIVKISGF